MVEAKGELERGLGSTGRGGTSSWVEVLRHESPSPEPEDLTPLNTMDMDFSPSEVDALEAIPPPSPPYWQQPFDPDDPRLEAEPSTLFSSVPYELCPSSASTLEPGDEPEDRPAEPSPDFPDPLLHLRQYQRQRRNKVHPIEGLPQPRRSARIAARKLNLPPTLPALD